MISPEVNDFRDALRAIWLRSAYDRGFISNPFSDAGAADLGLRRMEALLKLIGNPHLQYGVVHVAGSKGKGSTCAFTSSICTAAGYKTGLYTSPHLHSFRERIAIDQSPIAESDFTTLTRETLAAAEVLEREFPELGEVTAFELATAMAFGHFANVGCDLAVIEVGLGGTFDATNVVDPAVSVITALDFEHTRVLGTSLAEIAANKAGIIKAGKPVVSLGQEPEALEVIENAAEARESDLYLEGRDWSIKGDESEFVATGPWGSFNHLKTAMAGNHQLRNAGCAVASTWLLIQSGLAISESPIRAGLAAASLPGRYEVIERPGRPRIILDGAHTPASARALAETIARKDSGDRRVVVLGIMSDKDAQAIVQNLSPVADQFVATASKSPRAADILDVVQGIKAASKPFETAKPVARALHLAEELSGTTGTIVVTGSLATVAEAREALGLAIADPVVD